MEPFFRSAFEAACCFCNNPIEYPLLYTEQIMSMQRLLFLSLVFLPSLVHVNFQPKPFLNRLSSKNRTHINSATPHKANVRLKHIKWPGPKAHRLKQRCAKQCLIQTEHTFKDETNENGHRSTPNVKPYHFVYYSLLTTVS